MSTTDELYETLRLAQRLGFFGAGDLRRAIDHARHFVEAVPQDASLLMDLGSGGGLPALVVAQSRPALSLVLIERRQTRADFLERAIRRLAFADRVTVVTRDVADLIDDPAYARRADVVTARGFAQPHALAPVAAALTRPSGLVVVSDPPGLASHERWLVLELAAWDLEFMATDGVVSTLRRL